MWSPTPDLRRRSKCRGWASGGRCRTSQIPLSHSSARRLSSLVLVSLIGTHNAPGGRSARVALARCCGRCGWAIFGEGHGASRRRRARRARAVPRRRRRNLHANSQGQSLRCSIDSAPGHHEVDGKPGQGQEAANEQAAAQLSGRKAKEAACQRPRGQEVPRLCLPSPRQGDGPLDTGECDEQRPGAKQALPAERHRVCGSVRHSNRPTACLGKTGARALGSAGRFGRAAGQLRPDSEADSGGRMRAAHARLCSCWREASSKGGRRTQPLKSPPRESRTPPTRHVVGLVGRARRCASHAEAAPALAAAAGSAAAAAAAAASSSKRPSLRITPKVTFSRFRV